MPVACRDTGCIGPSNYHFPVVSAWYTSLVKTALIVISAVLTIASAIPYLVEIVRRKTKPRVVSWFTWSLLTGISCAASFADGKIASGVLLLAATMETMAIVVLGLKYGDRKFERLDIVCQVSAIVGLILWLVFNSPAIAVIASVIIDCIGAAPTIKHSWHKPYEETWSTFFLAAVGALATVFAAGAWTITGLAYPLYIVLINFFLAALVLGSPHRKLAGEPAELRKL